jgi:hypothetical protein
LRKFAAILLWGILLFNWVGYRLLNGIMEDRAQDRLEARIDRQQYDDGQLIPIKVPLTHLAYFNGSATFERAEGEIDVDGVPYRYVKSRIFNDSLEMLCIPNQAAMKWRQAGRSFFGFVNDVDRRDDPFIGIEGLKIGAPPVESVHYVLSPTTYRLPSGFKGMDDRPPAIFAA